MTLVAPALPVQALSVALGTTDRTRAFKAQAHALGQTRLDFADIAPIHRAFAPMVREQRFDISEMALVTALQARAYNKPLVLLPVAMASRFQESALLCRAGDATIAGPADLAGRRVGVRAYSQTTGAWIRGELAEDHGVAADRIRWVTFEDAHVAEYRDPRWAERAAPGRDMLAMLLAGEIDAAIVGNDVPQDPRLRTVFADPAAAAQRFRARHGFMPVNHMIVVRWSLAQTQPDLVAAFVAALRSAPGGDGLLFGREALQPAVTLAARFAFEQGLLPRALDPREVWDGLPETLQGPGGGR